MDFNFLSLPFLLMLPLILFIILNYINSPSSSTSSKPLPPGPKPWPVIGNILNLGRNPYVSMTNMAKIHGPLISLRIGSKLFVVGSSKMAATEIFKTKDRLLSGRSTTNTNPYGTELLDHISIGGAPRPTEAWKSLRALCRNELFSGKAIESQAALREKKVEEMVEFLGSREGKVVNIGHVVSSTLFNILSYLFFSNDIIGSEDNEAARAIRRLIERLTKVSLTPNIADLFPIVAGLDPQGLKKKMSKCLEEVFALWEITIKERRDAYVSDAPKNDFLDVFLANGFDDLKINWLFVELFGGGVDTTAVTVEWMVAELVKNKQVMKKIREELKRDSMKGNSSFKDKEDYLSRLPYLNACVKETLRLHPPFPFLLPHRALETCEVMNYTIPRNCNVLLNFWAIGRDPSLWEDPSSFNPERFLGSNLDFKGQHYEFLPFGGGRRMCPGLRLATRSIQLIVATLVDSFDWSLPNGQDLETLDMKERFGFIFRKEQPLLLVPQRRRL